MVSPAAWAQSNEAYTDSDVLLFNAGPASQRRPPAPTRTHAHAHANCPGKSTGEHLRPLSQPQTKEEKMYRGQTLINLEFSHLENFRLIAWPSFGTLALVELRIGSQLFSECQEAAVATFPRTMSAPPQQASMRRVSATSIIYIDGLWSGAGSSRLSCLCRGEATHTPQDSWRVLLVAPLSSMGEDIV